MARESAASRDEALRAVERVAARLGVEHHREGRALLIRVAADRELRLAGGGGRGTLRAEALVNGEPDAVVVATPAAIIDRLARVAPSRSSQESG
jgi:hypothetical protein